MSAAKIYSEFSLILFITESQKLNFLSRGYVCVCVFSCLVMSNSLRFHGRSPPGSSVCGISQARILEWVAISSSRRSSQPRDQTLISCVSCVADGFFTHWTKGEVEFTITQVTGIPSPHPWSKANRGVMLWDIKPRALERKYKAPVMINQSAARPQGVPLLPPYI